jgi:hypothetical protein
MSSATDHLLNLPPYGVPPEVKTAALLAAVREQLVYHFEHCPPYARWLRHEGFDPQQPVHSLADVPFLPVGIFKRLLLSSIPESQVVRVLASSGTSGQVPSRIPLDQTTRNRQMKALGAILAHRLGGQRRPFLILDAPPEKSLDAEHQLSARVAGMRGYLMAATEQQYALRRDGDRLLLDREKVLADVRRWAAEGKAFCLLGYSYLLYEHVVRPLREQCLRIDLPLSTFVIHFGGWKRLKERAVAKPQLTEQAADVFGLATGSIVDIYGFTEQLGVIYPDDSQGVKRTPAYAEVLVRDPRTLKVVPDGNVGLLEFVCPLPQSYPGIAVLLDDMGRIVSRDSGAAPGTPGHGGYGTRFEIVGRAERAETRGCGDTLPDLKSEI